MGGFLTTGPRGQSSHHFFIYFGLFLDILLGIFIRHLLDILLGTIEMHIALAWFLAQGVYFLLSYTEHWLCAKHCPKHWGYCSEEDREGVRFKVYFEGRVNNTLLMASLWVWLVSHCVQLFCNPMDCSPPGSSVHGFSQARILEWVASSFSGDFPNSGIISGVSCITGRFFTTCATWEARVPL